MYMTDNFVTTRTLHLQDIFEINVKCLTYNINPLLHSQRVHKAKYC